MTRMNQTSQVPETTVSIRRCAMMLKKTILQRRTYWTLQHICWCKPGCQIAVLLTPTSWSRVYLCCLATSATRYNSSFCQGKKTAQARPGARQISKTSRLPSLSPLRSPVLRSPPRQRPSLVAARDVIRANSRSPQQRRAALGSLPILLKQKTKVNFEFKLIPATHTLSVECESFSKVSGLRRN